MRSFLAACCVSMLVSFWSVHVLGQTVCPPNVSFENGNFENWQAYTGSVRDVGTTNVLTLSPSPVNPAIHAINKRTTAGKDPYGNFPLVAPMGGEYSVRLGNPQTGARAEQLSYTMTVPKDQPDFTITYYYAVVFQDPNHQVFQQPRFIAKVFDIEGNKYLPCASFEYISTSKLPGFKKSTVGSNVYYKDWSPVTINLGEFSGKKIRLEFTTEDCTEGGHFGYAYVDIGNECSKSITGNTYCGTQPSITLTGPGGYDQYFWYNEGMTQLLGTGEVFNLSPAPPMNTKIVLKVLPYESFGCPDTLSTVIKQTEPQFLVTNPSPVCAPGTIDITSADLTVGSEPGLTFTYWTDAGATNKLNDPKNIKTSGTYYIRAQTLFGCIKISPVVVKIHDLPTLLIDDSKGEYEPGTLDITKFIADRKADYTYKFTSDELGMDTLPTPRAVSRAGTYFITATNSLGCSITKPVSVRIVPLPKIFVPTGFTPTRSENNTLYPFLTSVSKLISFKVYNKWGRLVYQTQDQNAGWDGQFQSEMHFYETYTWYVDAIDELGNSIRKTGNTILIR